MTTRKLALTALLLMAATSAAWAQLAKVPPNTTLPATFVGFRGKITGTITSLYDTRTAFFLKVTQAQAANGSTAKDPNSIVGRHALPEVRTTEKDGRVVPDPAVWAWIKTLNPGQQVTITVATEGKHDQLIIQEVPK